MDELGLTAEDGMAKAWFVVENTGIEHGRNGRLFGGAEAVNQALRYCWWAKPFTYLYDIPGIQQLEDWSYQWVANNRYRLPGSTPSCKIE